MINKIINIVLIINLDINLVVYFSIAFNINNIGFLLEVVTFFLIKDFYLVIKKIISLKVLRTIFKIFLSFNLEKDIII